VCRFGVPLSMLTDNAKELDGDLMTEICRLLKIEKLGTTVYKPSTNAAVERFHRTLNGIIAKSIDSEKDSNVCLARAAAHRGPSLLTLSRATLSWHQHSERLWREVGPRLVLHPSLRRKYVNHPSGSSTWINSRTHC